MTKTLFLDTNVYLHYRSIDQIDWPEIAQADEVVIVIPPVTIRELNRVKDSPHQSSKIRKRAAAVQKKLTGLFSPSLQAAIRSGVTVSFETRDPSIDFRQYSLNEGIQDDHLIATIIAFRSETPDSETALVTSDAGLTLLGKAARLGIETIGLPDALKLPEEPDPEQERINQLEKELGELKNRLPELSLAFNDGNKHATFALPRPRELTPDEIQRELNTLMSRYPKMAEKKPEKKADNPKSLTELLSSVDMLSSISPEAIAKYNTELDKFYEAYKTSLPQKVQYENLQRRTIQLEIVLANTGSAPAEDIDVSLHFPDGLKITSDVDFPGPPKLTEPPSRPKSTLEQMNSLYAGIDSRYSMPSLNPGATVPRNVSSPSIRYTKSCEVSIHVHRIKHTMTEQFDPIFVTFESHDDASSFTIDYGIVAADLPKQTIGQLHVIIQK